jgi:hypothetical protein
VKTYRVIEKDEKFFIERKDKKTGNRVLFLNRDKKPYEFETKEDAIKALPKNKRSGGWEVKPATTGAPISVEL